MEARRVTCVWFVIYFILLTGAQITSAEKCKFKENYVCGIEDCNCRYASPSIFSISSLYKRFHALVSRQDYDGNICDKCDVFCSKEKHINCYEGACDKQKGCVCRNCWSDETCSTYENQNNPVFQEQEYTAEINEEASVGEQILQLSANDPDLEMCVDKDNCPCGKIQYSITMGNKQQYFYIDPETGVLSLNKEFDSSYISPFILRIKAENKGVENTSENSKGIAVVTISVVSERPNVVRKRRSTHHRTRRNVQNYEALITKFTPEINSTTFFSAGCIINYRLFVSHNASQTRTELMSMIVTLTSTNLNMNEDSLVLNISNSRKSIANVTKIDPNSVELNITEIFRVDDYMELRFETTVRDTAQPLSVLQVAFSMNATGGVGPTYFQYGPTYSTIIYAAFPQVTFARNSAEVVSVETTLNYNVNVTLPYFNFPLIFEISTTVNPIRFLSIENVRTGLISSSVNPETPNPSSVKYTGVEDNVTSRVVLDFGQIKVLDKNQNVNTMKLEFSIKVNDHFLLENDSRHWIGIGVRSGNEMLWVGQERIIIFKNEPFLIAKITTVNNTAPTRYYMNDELYFSWNVTHANASYATAKDVKILILLANSLSLVPNGVTIDVGASRETYGTAGLKYTLSDSSFPKSSSASGTIRVKVKNDHNVTPLSDLNVEINLYYKTPDDVDRPVKTYRPNPGYFAGIPTFNLTSNDSTRIIQVGKVVEISLQIIVKKISLPGIIEVILPIKNQSAIMRCVPGSFAVVSSGSNIKQSINDAVIILNSTVNHTKYFDRATFNIGNISNKDLSSPALTDLQDNAITIKFQVILEDHKYISNGTKYWLGVGIPAGASMVWIGQIAFMADIPVIRRPRVLISPSTNGTTSMVQGDIVEFNFTISHEENSDAHAVEVEILWMMPAYTNLVAILVNSHNMQLIQTRNNLLFKLPILDFLETPLVSFSVQLDPRKTLKPGKNFAVTPVALTYKDKTKSETFSEPLAPMSVAFYVPTPTPPLPENAVKEFYNRGFLVDNNTATIYICKVSTKRNKPSCFWTNTKGAEWRAIDFLVINIIGSDHATKIVYGIGNNKMGYMKYLPDKGTWFSVSHDHWQKAKSTLSNQRIVVIDDGYANVGDPELSKEHQVENGEKWGANHVGIYYYTPKTGWDRKAVWDCCMN